MQGYIRERERKLEQKRKANWMT